MANQVEKVNAIAIADIEKIIGRTDDNIEKIILLYLYNNEQHLLLRLILLRV